MGWMGYNSALNPHFYLSSFIEAETLSGLDDVLVSCVGGTPYMAIKKVPVVLADNTRSGHGGTYEQTAGGANARMVLAWLDWQLKGKLENEKLFIGGDLTGVLLYSTTQSALGVALGNRSSAVVALPNRHA
jgi:hypothetical protein